MNEKDLIQLKEKITKSKNVVLKLEGEKEGLMKTLKNDWECNSIDEAETKLSAMEKDLGKQQKNIKDKIKMLETKLP